MNGDIKKKMDIYTKDYITVQRVAGQATGFQFTDIENTKAYLLENIWNFTSNFQII